MVTAAILRSIVRLYLDQGAAVLLALVSKKRKESKQS
jgi:hypothetical protein